MRSAFLVASDAMHIMGNCPTMCCRLAGKAAPQSHAYTHALLVCIQSSMSRIAWASPDRAAGQLARLYRRAMQMEVDFFSGQDMPQGAWPQAADTLLLMDFDETMTEQDSTSAIIAAAISGAAAAKGGFRGGPMCCCCSEPQASCVRASHAGDERLLHTVCIWPAACWLFGIQGSPWFVIDSKAGCSA